MRQTILILSRQQPFLLLFLVLCVLSGVAFWVSPADPAPLPRWVAQGWAAFLFFTGILCLLGILWQRWNVERGLLLERGALMIQAGAVIVYAGFTVYYEVPLRWVVVVVAVVWSGVAIWEARLIKQDLGRLKEVTE